MDNPREEARQARRELEALRLDCIEVGIVALGNWARRNGASSVTEPETGPAMLARLGLPWPDPHPKTNEPFVEVPRLRGAYREQHVIHYSAPLPPERLIATKWDDDGEAVEHREMTDEEFAQACEAYAEAHARWAATGGRHVTKGPEVPAHAWFRTASKRSAEGYYVPARGWCWTSITW